MRRINDLRAQARITSGDAMHVMGGVVFVLGLISLAVAIAIGLERNQIELVRVIAICSVVAVVLGGVAWIVSSFSHRLEQVEAWANNMPSVNGDNDRTVALLKRRDF